MYFSRKAHSFENTKTYFSQPSSLKKISLQINFVFLLFLSSCLISVEVENINWTFPTLTSIYLTEKEIDVLQLQCLSRIFILANLPTHLQLSFKQITIFSSHQVQYQRNLWAVPFHRRDCLISDPHSSQLDPSTSTLRGMSRLVILERE